MPSAPRVRQCTPHLDLPPLFRLVTLREVGDAFAHARAIAPDQGAGTLVHVGRFDLVDFAVVLEPEQPLCGARRAFYAGCVALADALSVFAPPEKSIEFAWPDAIYVDRGLVGGVRLAWPGDARDDQPPDWMVFGATIRTVAMGEQESGLGPLAATLDEEGFDDAGSGRLVESFARHLMVATDAWHEYGFAEIAESYLRRLTPEPGVRREIDDNGDLLVRRTSLDTSLDMGRVERRILLSALATPSWLDPLSGGPRT
jgi:biotin-(acetyl-CoA carboxylase) ligase